MMEKRSGKKKFALLITLLTVAVLVWLTFRKGRESSEIVPVCEVERGSLTISVANSGTIHSRDKVIITCELEGRSILVWLINEGTNVQSGDLLAEFDADEIEEDFQQQEVKTVNALTNLEIAQEKVAITKGDCEAATLDSEVELELARLDMDKFEKGDYPQEVRQNIANIALADEDVQRSSEKMEWSERLAKDGYLTRTELQADELALKRKKIDLEMAATKLNLLTNYTVVKQRAKLAGDLRRAERQRERTDWLNLSNMRTAEAQLFARQREYDQTTNRLEQLRNEIDKAKIYAPTNGFVLYASTVKMRHRWWTRPLTIGSEVSKREELIYMPLEAGMTVEVMIPEASLSKIFVGMPAKVKIDAFPGRVFKGSLVRIDLLPDAQSAQLNPGLKLYKCEVDCNFKDITVRPGMSCDVELIKEVYEDELYVPVQCVVRVDDQPRLYVQEGSAWVARNIEVGFDNNTMIHILSGVKEGDVVMLAPPMAEANGKKSDAALPEVAVDASGRVQKIGNKKVSSGAETVSGESGRALLRPEGRTEGADGKQQ